VYSIPRFFALVDNSLLWLVLSRALGNLLHALNFAVNILRDSPGSPLEVDQVGSPKPAPVR